MFLLITPRRYRRWIVPVAIAVLIAIWRWVSPAAKPVSATDPGVPVPVIMYHSLLPDGDSTYVIDPALFERDLQYLQQNGYTTVTVADLIAYVDEGKALPGKPIMLTFDDGYYNNYLYAHPLLKQYGMRAVISPIGSVSEFYSDNPHEQDRPRYSHVTWEQLTEMVRSGVWEIQHHSYNLHHTDQGRKGVAQKQGEDGKDYRRTLLDDLHKATTLLKERVGVTPTAFVYPFGAYTTGTDPVLQEYGLRVTVTCEERVSRISRDPDSLWRLGRYLRPGGVDSQAYFTSILSQQEAQTNGTEKN